MRSRGESVDPVEPPRPGEAFAEAAVKAAGGVIAGVGALGFVALVGGAIFYSQMAALGLPADRIVEAMPRSTLLVVGARMLVLPIAGVALGLAIVSVCERHRGSAGEGGRGKAKGVERVPRGVGIVALMSVFLIFVLCNITGPWWVYVTAVALAALLGSGVWFVGIRPPTANGDCPTFRVFGTVTAVAATLFAVAFGAAVAYLTPSARAVAIAWKGGPDIAGIYGASNATEVIIGEICEDERGGLWRGLKKTGVIVVIPRNEITRMLIGTNQKLDSAIGADDELLRDLQGRPRGPDPPKRSSASERRCTGTLAERLLRLQRETGPGIVQGP
jgi:hypothetical protein